MKLLKHFARSLAAESKAMSIVVTVIVAVIALSLTGTVVSATNDAVTALGTTYANAQAIVKLVPLVYVAGVLFASGFFIWLQMKNRKD